MLTPRLFEQLGDGSTSQRLRPVNVTGLTSGVASIALGHVCFDCIIFYWCIMCCELYCSYVADGAENVWIMVKTSLPCVEGCGVTRQLGTVLTRCFTVSFVRGLERRRVAVLGIEHQWTGDACCSLVACVVVKAVKKSLHLADAMLV